VKLIQGSYHYRQENSQRKNRRENNTRKITESASMGAASPTTAKRFSPILLRNNLSHCITRTAGSVCPPLILSRSVKCPVPAFPPSFPLISHCYLPLDFFKRRGFYALHRDNVQGAPGSVRTAASEDVVRLAKPIFADIGADKEHFVLLALK
jgi:hypothetical protein